MSSTVQIGDLLWLAAVLVPLAIVCAWCRWRGFNTAFAVLATMLALPVTTFLIAAAQYPAAIAAAPLADPLIQRIDLALGFDWIGAHKAVWAVPWFGNLLLYSYQTTFWGLWVACLLLAWFDRARLASVLLANLVCGLVVIVFFGLLPTIGPQVTLGIPAATASPEMAKVADHLTRLRAGEGTFGDAMTGLVFFPSYHTVGVALTAFGAAALPLLLRWALYLWSALVLISIPPIGGHYLTDLLFALVIVAVWLARRWLIVRPAARLVGVLRA